jgi:hypothetical protein
MFANGALRYTRLEEHKQTWPDSDADRSNFWLFGETQKGKSAMPCSGETRYGKTQGDTGSWTMLTCGSDRVPRGQLRRREEGSQAFAETGGHPRGSCK